MSKVSPQLKKYRLNIVGNDLDYLRSPMHGNSWNQFLNFFKDNNFEIFLNNFEDTNFDGLICFNFVHQMKKCRAIFESSIPFKSIVLLEPEAIHPMAHSNRILQNFNCIISTSPNWKLSDDQINCKYPLVVDSQEFPKISERAISTAMIQANKYSCIKGEQYSLRRNLIKNAIKGKLDIVLAGPGWDKKRMKLIKEISKYFARTLSQIELNSIINPFKYLIFEPFFWIGPVDEKISFLKNVKKNIVIENSSDYVSEKLIDSFRSGSIPFYVGPNLLDFGFPPNLVVECKPYVEDIILKLKTFNDQSLQEIQENIQHFIQLGGLKEWDHSFASLEIAKVIVAKFYETINQ